METIGDAYMVVSGLPERNGTKHADEIAKMSLDLVAAVRQVVIPHMPTGKLQLRAGIHTGEQVIGIRVGRPSLGGSSIALFIWLTWHAIFFSGTAIHASFMDRKKLRIFYSARHLRVRSPPSWLPL